MSCRWEPVHLSCNEGLVRVSNWAPGQWPWWRLKPNGDVA